MTAVLAVYYRGWRVVPRAAGPRRALVATVGAVVTGATVLPAFLGFAEPVRRGVVVVAWLKTIAGVLVCGALLALGNWIYTLCALQWSQTGLPPMPPMMIKPGGGDLPVANAQNASIPFGTSPAAQTQKPETSWINEYQD